MSFLMLKCDLNATLSVIDALPSITDKTRISHYAKYVCRWVMKIEDLNIMSEEEVIKNGTYFNDDMGWSKECQDILCDENGNPFNGLLYEYYKNGNLAYYCYYKDGIEDGEFIQFYPSGKVHRYINFNRGLPLNESYEWYENGNIKELTNHYQNDFHYKYIEYDENGKVIKKGEV